MTTTTTEAKWAARVEAWRRSGESATVFAEGQEFSAPVALLAHFFTRR